MFIGYPIATYGSSCIDTLTVNPITGKVQVKFMWGGRYVLKASRRAILDLMANSDCSLGRWVNWNCYPA